MDANIILSGRSPNILANIAGGNLAAQNKMEYGRQNALANTLQTQGPGIMAGNPNALNALARFDPQAALGVQQTRQNMAFNAEEMQMRREDAKARTAAALAESAAQITADQLAQETKAIEDALSGAAYFHGKNDPVGYERFLAQRGLNPAEYPFEQFPAIAATYEGALDAMKAFAPPEPPKLNIPTGYMPTDPTNPRAGVEIIPGFTPKESGVTVNNITDGNSGAFGKKADEKAAERFDAIVAEGRGAQAFLGDLATLAALAPQIGTGKTAEVMAAIGPYADALGIPVDGLGEAQAYQAIVDRLAPNMRPAGAGATSDFDARQFLSSLPSLGRTPEGNAIIVATLQAVQENKVKAAEIANRAFANEITWQDADKQIAALANPYETFKKAKTGDKWKPSATVIDGFSIEAVE